MIEPTPKTGATHTRNIFKMLDNRECLERIKSINNEYLYWDKVKYQPVPGGYSPADLWSAVKLTRQVDSKPVHLSKYRFSFNQTDPIQRTLHEFDLNFGGNLGAPAVVPEQDKQMILVSSVMEEAIASSQMEGAVTTRKKAKEMLRKNEKPRSRSDQMILNNYQTIRHIVEDKMSPLTPGKLLEIHRYITANTLDDRTDEGCFRGNDDIYVINHVTSEVVYTPPPYGEIPGLIEAVCDFYNKDTTNYFIHPVIKGIILHFFIAWIHPFADGNGRTARALFYRYLLSKGYWLTEYLSISRLIMRSKNQYEKAYLYTEHDDNDLTYFIRYNLKTMELAYRALVQYIQRKMDEKRQLADFRRIPYVNERQAEIIRRITEDSRAILTVKEIETMFRVSNQTARTDLQQLADRGLLSQIRVNKKKHAFIRHPDFEAALKKAMQ